LKALISSEKIQTPRRLILLLVAVVAPISGFIPNPPIVATLVPVLESCQRRRIAPSRVMSPSYVSRQLGFGSIDLFDFTAIGIPLWLLGGAYLVMVSDRLLPNRGEAGSELFSDLSNGGYFTDVLIPVGSELVGQSIHNSRLQRRFDVDVLELRRGNQSFSAPLADHPLQTGDRLLLRCQRQDLLRLRQEHTIALAPIGDAEADVLELKPSGSTIAGSSVRELRTVSDTTPPCWPYAAATRC
jgi:di/tricarboxylate transporter